MPKVVEWMTVDSSSNKRKQPHSTTRNIKTREQFHSLLINTMAPHQTTPSLHSRSIGRNNGLSLNSIIKYAMLISAVCGVTFMWNIYNEISANQQLRGVGIHPKEDTLGVAPPKKEERMIRVSGNDVDAEMDEIIETSSPKATETAKASDESSEKVTIINDNIKQNRLYCMVPFIWTPSAFPVYHAIRDTWGKRCHMTKFFIDPIIGDDTVGFYNMTEEIEVKKAKEANMSLPNDVVILHSMKRPWHTCSDKENKKSGKPVGTCRNIWEKIWRAWVYTVYGTTGSHINDEARKNENGKTDVYNAEWFVKVDADTYLFPENLPRYIESRKWNYNDQHYFGHVLNHRREDRGVSIVAGAAVFFSRATLLKAAETFNTMSLKGGNREEDGTCRDAYTGTEEVVTAVCIKDYVKAEPAIDDVGREQISLYGVDEILNYNRTEQGEWWFWEGKKKYPCHDNPNDCLGHLPLAFHHLKNAKMLLDIDKQFYGVEPNKQTKSHVKKYFDKIRAAMGRSHALENQRHSMPQQLIQETDVSASDAQQRLEVQPSTADNNRLYCMVPFIWTTKYLPQYEAIRQTWGQRCDVLRFFIDPIIGVGKDKVTFHDVRVNDTAKANLPDDVVVVEKIARPWNQCMKKGGNDIDITCRNIWEKLWRSWLLMDETGELDKADWFTKIDADTYLFVENFKSYVAEKNWLPSEHHYAGHVLMHRTDKRTDAGVSIVAGAAVFFSR